MKYQFMQANSVEFSITELSRALGVSSSGSYAWLKRPESHRTKVDRQLSDKIVHIFGESKGRYGSVRIHKALQKQGNNVGRNRIIRLMQAKKLHASAKRKFKSTTESNHRFPIAKNKLQQDFHVAEPKTVYAGDITYIPTAQGWLYLAVIIDLYSRKVVGWAMDKRMTRQLVIDALLMAYWRRKPGKGVRHHSDRGSQYASGDFQDKLTELGFICSMSGRGNCYDNAVVESFFHTLKVELVHSMKFETRSQAKGEIFNYIESFYNRVRMHSTLGYCSPDEFERQLETCKVA